jgi:hypothetical protein
MYPGLAHEIVNRFALEFFDEYLRHSANTPLLSGEQAYPEVTLAVPGMQDHGQNSGGGSTRPGPITALTSDNLQQKCLSHLP